MTATEWDDADWCIECGAYGDDYYFDENGDLVCACDECVFNQSNRED